MQLVPSLRLGVFAACNTAGCASLVAQLPGQIVAHLDPAAAMPPVPAPSTLPLATYAGTYLTQRRAYRSVEKLPIGARLHPRGACRGVDIVAPVVGQDDYCLRVRLRLGIVFAGRPAVAPFEQRTGGLDPRQIVFRLRHDLRQRVEGVAAARAGRVAQLRQVRDFRWPGWIAGLPRSERSPRTAPAVGCFPAVVGHASPELSPRQRRSNGAGRGIQTAAARYLPRCAPCSSCHFAAAR